mmetsp:Transcript_9785/g.25690  ORF Transcript_9785/g.25690 Transcript_9785/m.25690 type:complete len:447 (-) Transcript_9785:116-1456(-)
MQDEPWSCQYKGCQSSEEQIAALRERKPTGFPHDEDPNLRVCTVCRRLSLREQVIEEDQLDPSFLAGIKEELSSIEENENNVQALSQVFRYYAKHSKRLSQVLYDFVTKTCFPWELIHALHLVDDILLMDSTGRYKAELLDRVQAMAVCAFRKVQKEQEKREVARMLHAWQELKIFDASVMEAIRTTIRGGGAAASQILDEAAEDDELEAVASVDAGSFASTASVGGGAELPTAQKKRRVEVVPDATAAASGVAAAAPPARAASVAANGVAVGAPVKPTVDVVAMQRRTLALVERIHSVPLERPFEVLGLTEGGATGHDIRKAYRGIALIIHPDKNPGLEARCQEALIKLQQAREQAETEFQKKDTGPEPTVIRGETRSAASAAAANAFVDMSFKCKYPGCDLQPCKQCANGCCTRNITHCHLIARSKGGLQCFFHPPPRAWARNA